MSADITLLSLDRACLPVAICAHCGKRSLTYLDVSGDHDVERCLSCDGPVHDVGRLGLRAVEALGYALIPSARKPTKVKAKSKCGVNGVRGCGSGGCSSGSCGTGGGCGSGSCGTK